VVTKKVLKNWGRGMTQPLVPNHVIGFDTKEGSEPATFIEGVRMQFDGIELIFTGTME